MLSSQSRVLWAKKSKDYYSTEWLPLHIHMEDAIEVAKLLWNEWLPACTRREIIQGVFNTQVCMDDFEHKAESVLVFLAAVHDIGKATPVFQERLRKTEIDRQLRDQILGSGLPSYQYIHPKIVRHYLASQLILERAGFSREFAIILGGHHGHPPGIVQLNGLGEAYQKDFGWGKGQEAWMQVQCELLNYALKLAGVSENEAKSWKPNLSAQVLLSGLVIMTDWIASDEVRFPYVDIADRTLPSLKRAELAWEDLGLPECWIPNNAWMSSDYFFKRFSFNPRPIQQATLRLLGGTQAPGITIIEAPMGEGKTEAAFAAAELLAYKTKRSGVFLALPTQASANGLFERACKWIENLEDDTYHAVRLVHGKANLNELYNKIKVDSDLKSSYLVGGETDEGTNYDGVIVHDWFKGRKKGILADFVIGTIDQVLMGALKQKHLALRHLGLANKVVILDECHAYDAYMSNYLYKVLSWLGIYGVPVVILSATLPGEKRLHLVEAYLNKSYSPEYDPLFDEKKPEAILPFWASTRDYPIITYSDGCQLYQEKIDGNTREIEVSINELTANEEIVSVLDDLLSDGGCAGVIVNTVKRAQKIAEALKHFGEYNVTLLHSRFIAKDRARKEKELLEKLGPNGNRPLRHIVVGTQIFEQSCDLDFDVLITDICPMDLLIQRMGRMHRHSRATRPPKLRQAKCYITGIEDLGFDRGAEIVYGKFLLMKTKALLPFVIKLPYDIPALVQDTYSPRGVEMPSELHEEYIKAQKAHEEEINKKESKAQTFQISDPVTGPDSLTGWIDMGVIDPSGKRGEATVRDTVNNLEVLVVQKCGESYHLLPWIGKNKGRIIPADSPPDPELARELAECSIQLPLEVCRNIDKAIDVLEETALGELQAWQQSDWLRGELFLVLDEEFGAEFCGYHLWYDRNGGLYVSKIEKEDSDATERV